MGEAMSSIRGGGRRQSAERPLEIRGGEIRASTSRALSLQAAAPPPPPAVIETNMHGRAQIGGLLATSLAVLLAALPCASGGGACENVGSVPSGLRPGVEELSLDGQNIVNLTSLSGFPDLKRLTLSDNLLSVLPLSRLQGADGVEEVRAEGNRIRAVEPAHEGAAFPLLAVLDLSDNQMRGLAEGDLRGATALQELRLSRNPLRSLPPTALAGHVAKGAHVYVDDTPLACACALSEELREWALLKGVTLHAECLGEEPCTRLRAHFPENTAANAKEKLLNRWKSGTFLSLLP